MTTLKALHDFSGPDGKHRKGDTFQVNAERAEFLTLGGYAIAPNPAEPAPARAPAPTAAPERAAVKPTKTARRK